jgi:hypothetical protein
LAAEGDFGEFDGAIGLVAGDDQAVDLVDCLGQRARAGGGVYDAGGTTGAPGAFAQARIAAEEFFVEAAAGEVSLRGFSCQLSAISC